MTSAAAGPAAPDRNLALELVRVTEAAAMAAGPLGRPRRQERRRRRRRERHAHASISSVSMNGVVVIGEGEKDDAPMLFNGERVGDGDRRRGRRRRRPDRRHHAHRQGHAQRHLRAGRRRPRRDVRPVGGLLHGEAGHRPARPPTSSTSPRRWRRTSAGSPRPRASAPEDVTVVHPRPPAARRASSGRSGRPAPGSSSSPTATSPARSWRRARAPASTCSRHRRHPRGHHRGLRDQVPRRRHPGPAVAAGTTTSGSRRSTPGTTWTACCTTDDLVTGDNVFFVATGITDGELLRGVRYRAGGARRPDSLVMRSQAARSAGSTSEHRLSQAARPTARRLRPGREYPDARTGVRSRRSGRRPRAGTARPRRAAGPPASDWPVRAQTLCRST